MPKNFAQKNMWKFYLLLVVLLVPMCILKAQTFKEKIITKEKGLLDRWKLGDTYGFIEAADSDITYFDPTLAERIDGIEKFRKYLSSFNGTFSFPGYELLNQKVQMYGDIGILTFNFVGHLNDGKTDGWNATEVYRITGSDLKIVSSHWSHTKP
jgi:hypothetical protein